MSLGGALELTPGAVVELDQGAAEPVELFANGVCFASGSLVVTGEGSWGVKVESTRLAAACGPRGPCVRLKNRA